MGGEAEFTDRSTASNQSGNGFWFDENHLPDPVPANRRTVMHLVRADGNHITALCLYSATVGPRHVPAFPHDPEPVLVMRVSGKPARRRDDDAINALQAGACDFNAVIVDLLHGMIFTTGLA